MKDFCFCWNVLRGKSTRAWQIYDAIYIILTKNKIYTCKNKVSFSQQYFIFIFYFKAMSNNKIQWLFVYQHWIVIDMTSTKLDRSCVLFAILYDLFEVILYTLITLFSKNTKITINFKSDTFNNWSEVKSSLIIKSWHYTSAFLKLLPGTYDLNTIFTLIFQTGLYWTSTNIILFLAHCEFI